MFTQQYIIVIEVHGIDKLNPHNLPAMNRYIFNHSKMNILL